LVAGSWKDLRVSAMSACGSYVGTTSRRQVNGRAEHPNVISCCEEEWSLVGCGGETIRDGRSEHLERYIRHPHLLCIHLIHQQLTTAPTHIHRSTCCSLLPLFFSSLQPRSPHPFPSYPAPLSAANTNLSHPAHTHFTPTAGASLPEPALSALKSTAIAAQLA